MGTLGRTGCTSSIISMDNTYLTCLLSILYYNTLFSLQILFMEKCKKGEMSKNVEMLLNVEPKTRDNDGDLSLMYLFHYWNWTKEEFIRDRMPSKIERTRRELQQNNPKLRGTSYEVRQIHAKVKREEYSRSQEKPEKLEKIYPVLKSNYAINGIIQDKNYEDRSNIFSPIDSIPKEKKTGWINSIKNIIKSL